jgi:signal transduction histidine kinase
MDWRDSANKYNPAENIHGNPGLVKDVYIWQSNGGRKAGQLLALNPHTAEIESSPTPHYLNSLIERLQARSSNLTVALHAWENAQSSNGGRVNRNEKSLQSASTSIMTGWQFDQNIPAIVHPIVHPGQYLPRVEPQLRHSKGPVDWIVVVLDVDTIQQRILPELTKRYFSSEKGLEYRVALAEAGKPLRLIYSSDPQFPGSELHRFDSQMNIFGPPPESVEGHLWQAIKNSESLPPDEWRSFLAPVWFPVIEYTSGKRPWTLLLQHRGGPLQGVAANIWRRNLMTGGILLLLLTVDMVLIVLASRRAQKLAKLQLDFAASVSHELLTPLAAIYCTGQNIRDGVVQAKADLSAHATIITSQARQLTELVRQILLFASMENGVSRYCRRPWSVPDLVQCARKNTAAIAAASGFTVEQRIPSGLPPVMVDLTAVSQCLQNLISNAIKYSGESRWILISAALCELEGGRAEIRINVEDRGIGISSAELRHIFKPFYRSPSATAAQIHGTGLGLAVSKRIAESMGGRLSVASHVGVGSTFTLHLPVALKPNAKLTEQLPFAESLQVSK